MVLVNEDFVWEAEVLAKSRGLSTLPHGVMPRKIDGMPPEEIEAVTEKIAEEIVASLKAGAQS